MSIKTLNGLAWASVKTRTGLAIASIKAINGLAVPAGSATPELLWWKMNEGSGTTLGDSSSGAGGAGTTDADWVTGKSGSGYALDFNGSSDDASTTSSLVYTGITEITFCAWINLDALGTGTYIIGESSANLTANSNSFAIYIDGSTTPKRLYGAMKGATGIYRSAYATVPSTGSWVHLACVLERNYAQGAGLYGRVRHWYDGSAQSMTQDLTTLNTTATAWGSHRFYLGARGASSLWYSGLIDDVRIYSGDVSANLAAIIADPQ